MPDVLDSAPASAAKIDLTTFCRRLSKRDRQVELIAAFNSVETAAGRLWDAPASYQARYAAFATTKA